MNKYRNKQTILNELNLNTFNANKTKQLKDKFANSLLALNLNIDKLVSYSYQIADIQLIYYMHNKPITSVQEAQILGCSQATIAKLHNRLSKANLLKIIANPKNRLGHNKRQLKYLIIRL